MGVGYFCLGHVNRDRDNFMSGLRLDKYCLD
jgi:hypothetical protein